MEVEPIIFYREFIFFFVKNQLLCVFSVTISSLSRDNYLLVVIGLIERYYVLIKVDRKSSMVLGILDRELSRIL